jgi:hypothetical protein
MTNALSQLLMAAKGTTYGTLENPLGTAAIALIEPATVTPLVAESVDRTQVDGKPGRINSPVLTKTGVQLGFSTYLAGSGTAGTVSAAESLLLQACGMNQTVQAGTSVTYALVDIYQNTPSWVDLRLNAAGEDHVAVGARGTYELTMESGQCPRYAWTFDGLFPSGGPTNTAMPAPTFSTQALPVAVDAFNTPTVTLGSFAACLNSFTLNIGNSIARFDDAGCAKQVYITDRVVTASITVRRPQLADFNAFTKAVAGSTDALQIIHGPAGARTTINIPKFTIGAEISPTAVENRNYYTYPLIIQRSVGACDDFTIVKS